MGPLRPPLSPPPSFPVVALYSCMAAAAAAVVVAVAVVDARGSVCWLPAGRAVLSAVSPTPSRSPPWEREWGGGRWPAGGFVARARLCCRVVLSFDF